MGDIKYMTSSQGPQNGESSSSSQNENINSKPLFVIVPSPKIENGMICLVFLWTSSKPVDLAMLLIFSGWI